ncbi:MAG: hypothetical protein AAFX94_24370, partial [Myxococcota bacterium]
GASSLADYMHDLFAEKLADDMLFGGSVSKSHSQRSDRDRPATRALTPVASSRQSAASVPDTVEEENTVAEDEPRAEDMTSAAGSGSWVSASGWSAVHSQPESQTQTHIGTRELGQGSLRGMVEEPMHMEHVPTEPSGPSVPLVYRRQSRPSPVVVASIAGVIIALIVLVTVVIVSGRDGPDSVPHSGPLIVDSEPRGAKVLFQGFGSQPLNDRYAGETTPFTINEGVPVGPIMQAEFIREGFSRAKVDLPRVVADEVPPALFAELVPDTETNKATLSFTSEPLGANVYVGGRRLDGTTPIEEYRITSRLPGSA